MQLSAMDASSADIKIKTSKPRVAMFIDQCSSMLSKEERNCVYSPSYSKVFTVISSITEKCKEKINQNINNNTKSSIHEDLDNNVSFNKSKRKRSKIGRSDNDIISNTNIKSDNNCNNNNDNMSLDDQWSQILEVLTDYAMLHLGGKKYISKRLYSESLTNNKITVESKSTENIIKTQQPIENISKDLLDTSTINSDSSRSTDQNICLCKQRVSGFCPYTGRLRYHKPANELNDSHRYSIDNLKLISIGITPLERPATAIDIGKWGEKLVYQYLQHIYPNDKVVWLNEINESRACFDLTIETTSIDSSNRRITKTTFIEVKSTGFADHNVCEISLNEWQFATNLPRINYHVYRVHSAVDFDKCHMTVVTDVLAAIEEGSVKICLAI